MADLASPHIGGAANEAVGRGACVVRRADAAGASWLDSGDLGALGRILA
jgi:hypothetical protein